MQAKYRKLRGLMYENQVLQQDIAVAINRDKRYVSDRMTGKRPFNMEDVYHICNLLEIPYDMIHIYFPPDGVEQKRASA